MATIPPHTTGPIPSSTSAAAGNGATIGYDYTSNTYYHQPAPAPTSPGSVFDQPSSSTHDHGHLYSSSHGRHPQPYDHQDNEQTLANTLANSHHQGDIDHLIAPAPTRLGGGAKFTEEWDASQRGSSIINGPVPRRNSAMAGSIQRSNSFSGSTTGSLGGLDGHSSVQVSRNNTLKKRSSVRRASSMRRSGSRRSMKAGSVRSLALQSNPDEDELHSAFHCPVPTSGNPTEALAGRFQGM
jgi:hypothetical protein